MESAGVLGAPSVVAAGLPAGAALVSGAPAVSAFAQGTVSLYVGNLNPDTMEDELFNKFSEVGRVTSVRICRDYRSRRSLGYGYVNYTTPEDATRAMDTFNHELLRDKPMRVLPSQRDPSQRRSGAGNIFISSLHKSIDSRTLQDTFSQFGSVISCKVATDDKGQSRGYGYVQYASEEHAKQAIEKLNGAVLSEMTIRVYAYKSKVELQREKEQTFRNVFVKGLPTNWTKDNLDNLFKQFGEIERSTVRTLEDGTSKGFGFVEFKDHESAAKSVAELNGRVVEERELSVARAQSKKERLEALKRGQVSPRKHEGENLYVKNLEEDVNDEALRKMFEPCGTVKSARVMLDQNGRSRGFAFVSFGTQEEAAKAVTDLNGKFTGKKPLYVAKFQSKDERTSQLRMQFEMRHHSQMTMGMYPAPYMNMMQFPPGFPNYMRPANRPVAGIPAQPRGYPSQYRAPMQAMPMGGRQPGRPPMQGYNANNANMIPYQNQAMAAGRRAPNPAQPAAVEPLNISALASLSPQDQKQAIGERLYPNIEARHGNKAAKITGMLLEMDTTELLHLLEDHAALITKEQEALRVLQESSKN